MEGSVEHFVPLERLPDGLTFPSDLGDRIRYDAEGKRLVFEGFMSKADFDRLCQCQSGGGDWAYRRALEDLFRLCTPEERTRRPALMRVFSFW
jgi:hypothetical protein